MATQPHWSEIASYEEEQFHQRSFTQQYSPKTIQQATLESMQSSPSKINKVADVKVAASANAEEEDDDDGSKNGMEENRIPVTCLTGFLGAGKTTLLNRILSAEHGKKIGVVINEWGAIGIDDKLVKLVNTNEEVYEMNNGCVCCTVRGDLIRVLHNLVVPDDDDDDDNKKPKKTKFDMIIIETTGLADPGPVVQTMFMDEEIKENAYMDGVICVVDCGHVLGSLDRPRSEGAVNESAQQIAFADRLILNKIDLVNDQQLKEVERRIRVINPFADIIKTKQSVVPIEKLLSIKSFDLDRILQIAPEFLENEKKGHEHEHGHSHDCKDQSCSHGHSHGDHASSSTSTEEGKEHVHSRHDDGITSVGFERPGMCDMTRLNHFFASFVVNQGKNLFRYKGVLCVDGLDQPLVFSGVHMQLTSEPQGAFPTNRPREMNYLVFIGIDINKDQLIKDFEECLVKKQPSDKGNGNAITTSSQQKKQ